MTFWGLLIISSLVSSFIKSSQNNATRSSLDLKNQINAQIARLCRNQTDLDIISEINIKSPCNCEINKKRFLFYWLSYGDNNENPT